MDEHVTRFQGLAMLITMVFPFLGAAMAISEITGRCRWVLLVGATVMNAALVLLGASSFALIVALVAVAIRMVALGR